MKKNIAITSIILLLITSMIPISYNISLCKENKALIAKQDSLYTYTLSEAQKVFRENGLKWIKMD